MSAVIWLGIVAVWAFVLIPTWVRRSDIHWRRSGEGAGARETLGRAARVVSRSGSRGSARARQAVRRPVHASRPATVPAARRPAAATRVTVPSRSVSEAETEVFAAIRTGTPIRTETTVGPDAQTETLTAVRAATEHVTSAPAAPAAEPEATMTTPRTPRPAPRRAVPVRDVKPTPSPQVQRARRLVWLGATALATLLLAIISGGLWIALHLLADVALVGYLRHLRVLAVQQQAARRARARGEGRRVAAPRGDSTSVDATSVPASRVRSARVDAEHVSSERVGASREQVSQAEPAPRLRRMTGPGTASEPVATGAAPAAAPDVIDLTDEALHDDCPTTELVAARAV